MITCRGEVVSVAGKTGGMAIKFSDLSSEDAKRITRFAASVAKP